MALSASYVMMFSFQREGGCLMRSLIEHSGLEAGYRMAGSAILSAGIGRGCKLPAMRILVATLALLMRDSTLKVRLRMTVRTSH